jgi:integrase/recombinase XerD
MTRPSFSVLMQAFFSEHLANHKRASPETICSYRDTFRLLLKFVQEKQRTMPSDVAVTDLDAPVILSFLDHLEAARRNSIRSRNLRLAAIRSFFRYIALRDPDSLPIIARVLAIPVKRADHRLVSYLTRPEVDALLAAPDRAHWLGRRDHALLLTFYNTGARLSELKELKRSAAVFGATASLHLHGKGRKDRQVPLWPNTARILRDWFSENADVSGDLAFPNARKGALSSDGVAYILNRAVTRAILHCPSLSSKRVTPHVLRHTTAMHLLQSGVDIAVIALWLGHETIETTHIYVEADLVIKEKALGKLASPKTKSSRFKPSDRLISFLSSL